MTTAATPLRKDHTCNGVVTAFLYDWRIETTSELIVTLVDTSVTPNTETTLTINTHYTISNVGVDGGGNVNTVATYAADKKIIITPNVAYEQDADFTNQNSVKPQVVENQLDKLCRQVKQVVVELDRTIRIPLSDTVTDAATVINTILGYKEDAEAAKDAAEAAYDALDDRWLGAKSSDPTLDNDGNALVTGATYYNTSSENWRYYNGTVWNDMSTPAQTSETGDIRPTWKATATAGWVFIQGQSFGDTGSGADLEGASYEDVYTFLWNNIIDTHAPVSSGRGASAAADFAAGKTITMPNAQDSTPFGAGSTWALGQAKGSETITQANLPATPLSLTGTAASDGAHTHDITLVSRVGDDPSGSGQSGWGGDNINKGNRTNTVDSNGAHTHSVTGTTENMGSGTAFLPKGFGVNWEIKL